MTRPWLALACGIGLAVCLTRPQPVVAQDVTQLLARARAYLAAYERGFALVVSEEHYDQHSVDPLWSTTRTMRSAVIAANVGEDDWVAFRDVFEVDGTPVRDRDERLQNLFLESDGQAIAQANRIMAESARYNLGRLQRNVNVPTMALVYLRGSNQSRSTFKTTGHATIHGVLTESVAFTERASPTVIRSGPGDLPATGRFWIDPTQGRVVKSELSVVQSNGLKATIAVTYAPVSTLSIWVPVVMTEEYSTNAGDHITSKATYSHFRQFAVIVTDDLNGTAYVTIGAAQLEAKDYAGAEISLRRALELDPTLARAYTALGLVLEHTSRKSDAIDAWKEAVELDGEDFKALLNLVRTLAEVGRHDEARVFGERFIATAPPTQYRQDIADVRKLLDAIR
jgi:tetratricopeptide (TPR) repeat protein